METGNRRALTFVLHIQALQETLKQLVDEIGEVKLNGIRKQGYNVHQYAVLKCMYLSQTCGSLGTQTLSISPELCIRPMKVSENLPNPRAISNAPGQ